MGIVVVDGGILPGGNALNPGVGKDGVAIGSTGQMALDELGGMAYFEFDID